MANTRMICDQRTSYLWTGLKQLTIYVSMDDSIADIAPVLKALLGAPLEAVVKVQELKW
jgi:hypothetical protein